VGRVCSEEKGTSQVCWSSADLGISGNCASSSGGSSVACSNQPVGAKPLLCFGKACGINPDLTGNACTCGAVQNTPTPTPASTYYCDLTTGVAKCVLATVANGGKYTSLSQCLGDCKLPSVTPTPDPRDLCGLWRSDTCSPSTGGCSSGQVCVNKHAQGLPCSCSVPTPTPTNGMPRGCSDSNSRCIYGNGTGAVNCGSGFKNTGTCTTYASQGSFLVDGICCAPDQPTLKACSVGTCTLDTVCPARKMENTPRESCSTNGAGILQSGICCIDNPNLVTPTNTVVPTNRPSVGPTTIPTSIPTTVQNPTPTTGGGGGGTSSCGYSSLQSRVQANDADAWKTSMTVVKGETINIGCMYNASAQLASNVKMIATYSDGSKEEFGTNKKTDWIPNKTGVVTIKCQSIASNCNNLNSDVASVTVTAAACYDCPSIFKCYKNGNSYKWFVAGYEQAGYEHDLSEEGIVVQESECTTRQVAKPTFKGKAKADADCNGVTDQADYSIWRKEYIDKIKTGSRWESDFDCNNLVDQADYSNWRRFYLDF